MRIPPSHEAIAIITPAGLVDAETAASADVTVWDDDAAVRGLLVSGDTSIQRLRRRDTAA